MPLRLTTQLDNTEFTPGEILRGGAVWEESGPATVSLLYFTTGRSTQDVVVVEEKTLPAGSGAAAFEFQLPSHPWSLAGSLISLTWALELRTEATPEPARLEFTLSPTGRAVRLATAS